MFVNSYSRVFRSRLANTFPLIMEAHTGKQKNMLILETDTPSKSHSFTFIHTLKQSKKSPVKYKFNEKFMNT